MKAYVHCRASCILLLGTLAVLGGLAVPTGAHAQIWKQIRDSAAKKLQQHKQKLDSTLVNAASTAVDSGLNNTEHAVASGFRHGSDNADRLKADLATGRALLRDVEFEAGTAVLKAPADPPLNALAQALTDLPGSYLLEGHTDPTGDAAADQALSEQRAAAVKARLVALGVSAHRLFSIGYGSTRPLAPGPVSASVPAAPQASARIEVARMQ